MCKIIDLCKRPLEGISLHLPDFSHPLRRAEIFPLLFRISQHAVLRSDLRRQEGRFIRMIKAVARISHYYDPDLILLPIQIERQNVNPSISVCRPRRAYRKKCTVYINIIIRTAGNCEFCFGPPRTDGAEHERHIQLCFPPLCPNRTCLLKKFHFRTHRNAS